MYLMQTLVDRNWLFATLTFGTSSETMLDIFNTLNASVYDFNPAGGVTWNFAFEPLPSVMLSHSAATGGNVLGVEPEDGNGVSKLFIFRATPCTCICTILAHRSGSNIKQSFSSPPSGRIRPLAIPSTDKAETPSRLSRRSLSERGCCGNLSISTMPARTSHRWLLTGRTT